MEGTAGVGFWSDSHFRLLERVTSQTVTARVWKAALLDKLQHCTSQQRAEGEG